MINAVRRVEANPDKDTQMYHGFNPSKFQLIGSTYMRTPAESVMFDWSHCYLQDGLGDNEFGVFMKSAREVARYDELGKLAEAYKLPRATSSVSMLFESAKVKRALQTGTFQCDCSEFATLAPIIARYLREVVIHRSGCAKVQSMIAVLEVLELLPATRSEGTVQPSDLARAIKKHLDSDVSPTAPAAPHTVATHSPSP